MHWEEPYIYSCSFPLERFLPYDTGYKICAESTSPELAQVSLGRGDENWMHRNQGNQTLRGQNSRTIKKWTQQFTCNFLSRLLTIPKLHICKATGEDTSAKRLLEGSTSQQRFLQNHNDQETKLEVGTAVPPVICQNKTKSSLVEGII